MVKERDILFKSVMVRAVLGDLKTQTRRLGGLETINENPNEWEFHRVQDGYQDDRLRYVFYPKGDGEPIGLVCPKGQPGDRLWLKETYRFASDLDSKSPSAVAAAALEAGYHKPWAPTKYEADGATDNTDTLGSFGGAWGKTRVSIHMPRWASRITLEITGIRVERLQEISEEDAKAEGVIIKPDAEIAARVAGDTPARMEYWALWESINGAGSWDANPYVWAISFKRVESEVRK